MSASARLSVSKADEQAPTCETKTEPRLPAPPPAKKAPKKAPSKAGKGFTYRGICITCGEKIVITADKMDIRYFAFCNAECKARFEAEMNEDID